MATTGFWPVKGKLKSVIVYAENPDKTMNPKFFDSDLYATLQYAENSNKTDQELFVSGINCSKHNAYAQMVAVKKKFGEKGSVVAYHGYQSFKKNEVTPEECHEIGIETARKMWGDKYQVIVTTHLDKQHHLHNHFVINSTSFKDGLKFRNKIGDHYELRKISDAICKERGKSVLENAPFYGGEKKAYWLHKQGKKTHRDMLREDIEICLTVATNWDEFRRVLFTMGYEVDYRRFTIKAKDWERGVRVESLGYTVEGIEKRFNDTYYSGHHLADWNNFFYARRRYFPLESVKKKLEFSIEHGKRPEVIYVDTILLLIILVFQLLKEVADVMLLTPEMRHAAKDIKQYVSDYHFLTDNQIRTTDDLTVTIDETKAKIAELEEKRSKADNKRRRASTPEDRERYKVLRKEITKEITPLRKQIKQAEDILDKSPHLYELLQKEHQAEINKIRKLERTR
ncbi:MAG: relaxase/mobilization nuclease domain-containing protein [Acutalibacteraceae bacterium]|nr:relaxase/mobilization nuclease domain-containing protein [Acutalibacteraceae bacterium]